MDDYDEVPEFDQDGDAEVLLGLVQKLQAELKRRRPGDRSENDRAWSIALTEALKLEAFIGFMLVYQLDDADVEPQ